METKKVVYRGTEYKVPIWTKYLTTDADGTITAWDEAPYYDYQTRIWDNSSGCKFRTIRFSNSYPEASLVKL